jgi:hypothetical protein
LSAARDGLIVAYQASLDLDVAFAAVAQMALALMHDAGKMR